MRTKGVKRFLRLPFYRDETYNVSLELGLFESILSSRLHPTQRQSTAVATTVTPRFRSKTVAVFSIQPFKVHQKEGAPRPLMWKRIQVLLRLILKRLQVAEFLLKNGLRVRGNRTFVNDVEIPTVKVAGSRS